MLTVNVQYLKHEFFFDLCQLKMDIEAANFQNLLTLKKQANE